MASVVVGDFIVHRNASENTVFEVVTTSDTEILVRIKSVVTKTGTRKVYDKPSKTYSVSVEEVRDDYVHLSIGYLDQEILEIVNSYKTLYDHVLRKNNAR